MSFLYCYFCKVIIKIWSTPKVIERLKEKFFHNELHYVKVVSA